MPTDRPLVALLVLALAAGWILDRVGGGRRWARLAAAGLALLGLTGMLAARWVVSGHPPVFGTFEMDLAETWCLLLSGLLIERQLAQRYLPAPMLAALLTLAHTFLLRTEITPLTISEVSLWIDLHAALAWLSWCFYIHACLLAFRPGAAQQLGLRLLGLGFVAQSGMAFVGVYYGTLLFATPWSWDPVQILGLLSWLVAAFGLHLRLFYGASLQRLRYLMVVVVVVYIVSAKVLVLLPAGQSFHVFELGRMAGP